MKGPEAPRICVILDDCLTGDMKYDESINNIFTRGRHAKMAIWLISQTYVNGVSTTVRKNTDLALLLRTRSGTEARAICKELIEGTIHPNDIGNTTLPSGTTPKNQNALARSVLAEFTSNYSICVIDQREKDTSIKKMIFYFRVPNEHVVD
jgi:hypothetical protein